MAGSPTETTHSSAYTGPDLAPLVCAPAVGEDIFPLHSAKFLPRVLVVDDEGLLRWSLAETLVDAGYQVVQAANGCEARAAMANAQHLIDAMLVDLKLPDTDGLQLVREARRQCLTCPIIVNIGLQDNVCPPETGYALFQNIRATDKQLYTYDGHGHDAGRSKHNVIVEQFFAHHLRAER